MIRRFERRLRRNELVRRVAGPIVRRIRAARSSNGPASRTGHAGNAAYPTHFAIQPRPAALPEPWPEPPAIDRPFEAASDPGRPPPPTRYDLALFEQLNAEYAAKPIVSAAPRYDPTTLADRSRRRLAAIHDRIGLADRTVLEIGCAAGYEVWYLGQHLGCDAWGIDVTPRNSWPALAGDRVHLVHGDIADRGTLPAETFERVISFTVWEHITRPIEAIAELQRVMKPGALAWIRANLYRGPTASHRARDIHFPFPHLLFQDDVIYEALGRAGKVARGASWVNRLTWEQYELEFLRAGLLIRSLSFDHYPLDEAFYRRFEDVLGRYPREDLERGFFQVVLEKPVASSGPSSG